MIQNILKRLVSIIWSLFRLLIVMFIALFSALNKILFDNMEVISMSLIMRPQLHERHTLGFIDNLRYNNRELTNGATIPKSDAFDDGEPFVPDDLMVDEDDDEITFEGEDIPLDNPDSDSECEPDDKNDDDEDGGKSGG